MLVRRPRGLNIVNRPFAFATWVTFNLLKYGFRLTFFLLGVCLKVLQAVISRFGPSDRSRMLTAGGAGPSRPRSRSRGRRRRRRR